VSRAADPRRVVLELLLGKHELPTRRFVEAADSAGLEGRDRAFARHLLAGTIRHRRTLDAVFKPFCSRRTVDPAVLWTLRLALHQRFWMEQVPVYAAFGATLDAARRRLGKAVGFTNAVLRAVDRAVVAELPAELPPAADLLPAGERSWSFARPLFPDPAADPVTHAAVVPSFPDALARRWHAAVGADGMHARMRAFNRAPRLCLRVHAQRSSVEALRETFAAAGVETQDGPVAGTLLLDQPSGDLRVLPGFAAGHWSVQDASALEAVRLGDPRPGERVLDWCAAPGGKSFAACEHAAGEVEVHACDVDHVRLARLAPEAARLGHAVQTHVIGPDGAGAPDGPWDLVVLDVPCTNTGVLGKRPEARWRFTDNSLGEALATQRRIAEAVAPRLGPQTRVVWTTCSLEEEENRGGAEHLAELAGLRVVEERAFEPDARRSGGYAALLA
jgi:16S rRNA (cytosine967-C5)-methyltransferase